MARRIRRRPGVIWLPLSTENRLTVDAPVTGDSNALGQYALVIPGPPSAGANVTDIFPVVGDQPQNVAAATSSLADTEGSAYRLRRIVGKIYVDYVNLPAGVAPGLEVVIVTVGFIIIEVEPTLNFLPLSATADDYSVDRLDNVRWPWIWRRSWAVGNNQGGATRAFNGSMPQNNYFSYAGGVMDGPHIDAKTARTVKDSQRLAMVITATGMAPPTGGTGDTEIVVTTDLRVLGSLRKQSGNRHNASR